MDYDLIIIGAGWAGFNAARIAARSGLKVAVIEKDKIGGTCLNRGCIPTKALIQSAKIFNLVKKSANFGIESVLPKINFDQVQSRKEKIIQQLSKGIEFSMKNIEMIPGEAHFISNTSIDVSGRVLSARYFLVAAGSSAVELKQFKFDGKKIVSSDDILKVSEIPQSLLIIGGGVIGCEFASLFSSFGTQVTVVEKMPQILPGEDSEVARKLEQAFKKRGIKVNTDTDASNFDPADYSLALVCVGRAPEISRLSLDKAGVATEKGRIITDEYLRTSASNIFAAGDCTGRIMLAHFASYQGVVAALNIIHGQDQKKCDNDVVPSCIFTDPEVASVGVKSGDFNISRFDFMGSGMARIMDETEGFIKIFSDKESGRVTAASIIGPKATELIAVLTVAVSNKLSIAQLKDTIFAHPTLSESIHECL